MHLKYRVILELADGTQKDKHRTTKRRLASVIRAFNWVKGYIQVSYYQGEQFIGDNTGICDNAEEMLKTLDAFTEPELMEYLA